MCYRAATTKCLLSWNCAGVGVVAAPGRVSTPPLPSVSVSVPVSPPRGHDKSELRTTMGNKGSDNRCLFGLICRVSFGSRTRAWHAQSCPWRRSSNGSPDFASMHEGLSPLVEQPSLLHPPTSHSAKRHLSYFGGKGQIAIDLAGVIFPIGSVLVGCAFKDRPQPPKRRHGRQA